MGLRMGGEMKKTFIAILAVSFLLIISAAEVLYGKGKSMTVKPNGWYGDNAQVLSLIIEEYGKTDSNFEPDKPPVAAFDWDNTVIKNDVGDALTYWMLGNNKILQPPAKDWGKTSSLLTDEAKAALKKACSSQGKPGKPLITNQETPKSIACADEIFSIYDSGKTKTGAAAWENDAQSETMEPAYAWTVSLQAGYSPAGIRLFADEAIEFNLKNEIGAVQTIGSKKDVTAYIRIYDQIQDLISVMQKSGFDVWVISASSQPAVEAFAARVGINKDHVIGIRSHLDKKGKATADFQSCGTYPENNYDIITYKQGKRCWLNKVVFNKTTPETQMQDQSPLIFAAGDSDTDINFLNDAKYRLVINRNKPELMCNAYFHMTDAKPADATWIINPMFIKPKSKKSELYDCSKFGLPNQVDLVY